MADYLKWNQRIMEASSDAQFDQLVEEASQIQDSEVAGDIVSMIETQRHVLLHARTRSGPEGDQ